MISHIYPYVSTSQSCLCKTLKPPLRSAYAFLGFMNDSQLPDEISMTGKLNGHDFDLQLDCRTPLGVVGPALLRYLEVIKTASNSSLAWKLHQTKQSWNFCPLNLEGWKKKAMEHWGSYLSFNQMAALYMPWQYLSFSRVGCESPKLQDCVHQVAHFSNTKIKT